MRINFKNFGLLEALVLLSLVYVVGMLIWTASTRPAVEAKANLVKENHKKVVDFINGEINNCGNNDEVKGIPRNSPQVERVVPGAPSWHSNHIQLPFREACDFQRPMVNRTTQIGDCPSFASGISFGRLF